MTPDYRQTVVDACREILRCNDELVAMDEELEARSPGAISRASILKDKITEQNAVIALANAQKSAEVEVPESRKCPNVCPRCHHLCGHDLGTST